MTTAARQLVVGGAGFIGSSLARLLAETAPVRVLDDLTTGEAGNVDGLPGVELVIGSVLDADTVEQALDGIDVVFHLACLGVRHSIHSPERNHEVNATGTLRLLEAAQRAKVERFVYTSTSEVYGTALSVPMTENHPAFPHTVYGGSKLAGEAYVRAYHRTYGFPTVVLRPFNAYGPRSHSGGDSGEVIPRFITRLMNGLAPVVFGDGSQTRDLTYVDDTARGIALAASSDAAVGRTLNLGSGTEIRIDDLARLVAEILGREQLGVVYDEPRPGDVLRLFADAELTAEVLGWAPTVDLERGIRQLLAWHDQIGTDWERALAEHVDRNWVSSGHS
jgi:UDP-glucose 4-epimerase